LQLKSESQLLREVIYKEARGEGKQGMEAVGHVILNRSKAWNQRLTKVITGPNQFSCMSVPSDPQYLKPCPMPDDPAGKLWEAAGEITERFMGDDKPEDITNGALYYCNPKSSTSGWFSRNIVGKPKEHPLVAVLGKHHFYA
jgi:spore germination cell wall hydrolase CwlJ-like protein